MSHRTGATAYCIETDGLPDTDKTTLRLAFIFDGCIVSGWPLNDGTWEANDDVGRGGVFHGVTHYIVFDEDFVTLEKQQ